MAKRDKAEKPARQFTRRQLSHYKKQQRRQRIIFISGIAIISAIVLIVFFGWLFGEFLPMNRTAIEIGEIKFNMEYFIDRLEIAYSNNQTQGQTMEALTSSIIQPIEQSALIRQAAAGVGIEVSDDEAIQKLEEIEQQQGIDIPVNEATIDLIKDQMVEQRLWDEYLPGLLPKAEEQVNLNALFLESEQQALEIREQLSTGGNLTALAEEYGLDYYSKNMNGGEFGWHIRQIFMERLLGSEPAIDYAFGVGPGAWSQPLCDADKMKQQGYWLIKVLEKQYEEEAQVQALLLSSEVEALEIKSRLEAGDNITALAEEYSDYTTSKKQGGDLGLVSKGDISDAFDEYILDPDVEIGVWSDPIPDDTYWTQGGCWLLYVVDRDDDREISDDDLAYLKQDAYTEWTNGLFTESAALINHTYLTPERMEWAANRLLDELEKRK